MSQLKQIQVNEGEVSDENQCFGIAQSDPTSKGHQKPSECLKEGCAQRISLQCDRSDTFLR